MKAFGKLLQLCGSNDRHRGAEVPPVKAKQHKPMTPENKY